MSDYQVFRCPGCREFVNSTMTSCPKCSHSLAGQVSTDSIELQNKLNKAYTDASNIRILAGAMWVGFLFSFFPFLIGWIGTSVFYMGFFGVPILLIIWWLRNRGFDKSEPEIADSKRFLLAGLGVWAIYPIAYITILTLVFFGVRILNS